MFKKNDLIQCVSGFRNLRTLKWLNLCVKGLLLDSLKLTKAIKIDVTFYFNRHANYL